MAKSEKKDMAADHSLSHGQRALWMLFQQNPLSPAYNVAYPRFVRSVTSHELLQRAFETVIDRHAILGVAFKRKGDDVFQYRARQVSYEIRRLEVPGVNDGDLRDLAYNDNLRPFDIERGPLIRATHFIRSATDSLLLISVHHIICDFWSLGVIWREIWSVYGSLYKGEESCPPERRPTFYDYIDRETEYLNATTARVELEKWRCDIGDSFETSGMPVCYMNDQDGCRASTLLRVLDPDLCGTLRSLSKNEGTTPYVVLLCCFLSVLRRHGANNRMLIGTPVGGRGDLDFWETIGFFANLFPVIATVDEDTTFRGLISQVETALGATRERQKIPFPYLISHLRGERPLKEPLLLRSVFSYLKLSRITRLDEALLVAQQEGQFEFVLEAIDKKDTIDLYYKYDSTRLDISQINQFASAFELFARIVTSTPEIKILTANILPVESRAEMLEVYNDTSVPYPEELLIHELFEEQVRFGGGRIAIIADGEETSYRTLDSKANQLAALLRFNGVMPGSMVAVCGARTAEMVVAVIGASKAGCPFIPIDVESPTERARYMLEDSGAKALIIWGPLEGIDFSGITIDLRSVRSMREYVRPLPRCVTSDSIAYVIYTSGSTGMPKAAILAHKAVVNTLCDINRRFGVAANDRLFAISSLAFDLSIYDIFGILGAGASLVINPSSQSREPRAWLRLVIKHKITIWNSVPALMELLVKEADSMCDLRSLRLVLLSGDWIPVNLPDRIKRLNPSIRVISLGGATEASIWSIFYPIERVGYQWSSIPYGRPLSNQKYYVLDSHLEPSLMGVTGGLYIGGVGVGEGYLNDPSKTGLSFIKHPRSGERLYVTGDLGRHVPSGVIEFLGREDFQTKVNGHRIEMGEIEGALLSLVGIRVAVVVVRARGSNNIRELCAYYVGKEMTAPQLREQLLRRLPAYMIPSYFVRMDALPLTANGKIDRKMLPEPVVVTEAFEAPHGEVQLRLAAVFAEVLGLEKVGATDNYFLLGGDSIKAIQVVSRMSRDGYGIAVKDLFKYPTVRELSAQVTRGNVTQIPQGEAIGSVQLAPIQSWFMEEGFEQRNHFNQSVMVRVKDYELEMLQRALKSLVVRHDALGLVIRGDETELEHVPAESRQFPVEEIVVSGELWREQMELHIENLQLGFDLKIGPLAKAALFFTPEGSLLYIVAHHLVVDMVSWHVILEDLDEIYKALKIGIPITVPSKTHSYKYWSKQMSELARTSALKEEYKYWREICEASFQKLPGDGDRPKLKNTRSVWVKLDKGITRSILQEIHAVYNTDINDILLSALGLALGDWLGERRVAILLEGHGRDDIVKGIDVSRTVGWFTSLYPVILDHRMEVGSYLRRTKEMLRRVPQKGIGYGLLRYASDLSQEQKRQLRHGAEVSFNYLGQYSNRLNDVNIAPSKSTISGENRAIAPITINGLVQNGQFTFELCCDATRFATEDMEALGNRLKQCLNSIADHCASQQKRIFTASDFGDLSLSERDLTELLGRKA